jgi:hypothetical protein
MRLCASNLYAPFKTLASNVSTSIFMTT